MQNLQDNEENICPKCSTVIHETNPFEMLRYVVARRSVKYLNLAIDLSCTK